MTIPFIGRLFGSTDDETRLGGAGAVADAIIAALNDVEVGYAIAGEAELRDYGNAYDTDLKVVIPLESDRYDNPAPLTFDIPDSIDDDASAFLDFLDAVGINYEDAGDFGVSAIEGTEIPVSREDGRIVPLWTALDDSDEVALPAGDA